MPRDEPLSILAVDDSSFYLSLITDKLESNYGMTTLEAENGSDAMAVLEEESPDCIVSDYKMPDMDGLELYEQVAEDHDLPFVLLTAEGDEETASHAIQKGVDEYLMKQAVSEDDPMELLVNRIRNVVDQRRTQRKYELLVDNSPDEVAQLGADGEILAANESMAISYGMSGSELVGEQLSSVIPEAVAENRLEECRRALTAGSAVTFQDSVSVRHFHNVAVPLSAAGEDDTVQLVTREITHQKRNERELEATNQRLDQFASVVAHDLRNPLSVARGFLKIAKETGNEEDFETVESAHDRSEQLIEDLLTLARGETTIEGVEEIDLESITTEAWRFVDTEEATLTIVDEVPTVTGDAGRLTQLFENLFRNAVEHGGADITVTVGQLDEDDGFYVEDTGSGIPQEKRDDVFNHGVTSSEGGTGFGLSIVADIAKAHGWTVSVTDGSDGGARFEFKRSK